MYVKGKLQPSVDIIRLQESFVYGTFGVMRINTDPLFVTLEPPDKENLANKSSIPAQQYECEMTESPKYGWTYKVKDVPARTDILFHPGNIDEHTHGCILLGMQFGILNGEKSILASRDAYTQFMSIMNDKPFILTIKEVY